MKGQKGAIQETVGAQVPVVDGSPKTARHSDYCSEPEAKLFI